jgi:murein DD-endopeptidase MepM/ murein hydrolase activator NlpD
MPDYISYLNASLPDRQAALSSRKAEWAAKLQAAMEQQANNYSAPIVSGSGASLQQASIAGAAALTGMPKTVGGKVNPITGRVSQNWGKSRIHYAAGRHTGMDFGVAVGTQVRAAANGIVIRVGGEGAYGNTVHIRHPDGTTSVYAHLSRAGVKAGQRVKSGQSIARSGNSGRSTGAHLHFEVRTRDRYGSDVNPRSWLGR